MAWDLASWLVLAAAIVVTVLARSRRMGWMLAGVGVYLVYVLVSAASATSIEPTQRTSPAVSAW